MTAAQISLKTIFFSLFAITVHAQTPAADTAEVCLSVENQILSAHIKVNSQKMLALETIASDINFESEDIQVITKDGSLDSPVPTMNKALEIFLQPSNPLKVDSTFSFDKNTQHLKHIVTEHNSHSPSGFSLVFSSLVINNELTKKISEANPKAKCYSGAVEVHRGQKI